LAANSTCWRSASEETICYGSRTNARPEIDGKLFINDFGGHEQLVPGTFYRCEITEAMTTISWRAS